MTRVINGRKRQVKPMINLVEQIGIAITLAALLICLVHGFVNNI